MGRSWGVLGRSWPLLGRSWAVLGRSWALLGRSSGVFGPLLECSWPLLSDLGASGGDFESFGGGFLVDLGSIWWIWVDSLYFCSFFAGSALMRRNVPQVSQTLFPRKNIERRPWEGLRSSLPLSALPVLAQTGLGRLGRSWGDLGAVLGRLGRSWGGLWSVLGGLRSVLNGLWRSWGGLGPCWGGLGSPLTPPAAS